MENNLETDYIQRCLKLVEIRFDRGANSEWSSYDFEKLSDAIQEATGVVLSVTTLKRLWGKLSYTNTPAITTLNTLAQYAGYEDWGMFRRKLAAGNATPVTTISAEQQTNGIAGSPGINNTSNKQDELLTGSQPAGALTSGEDSSLAITASLAEVPGTRPASGAKEVSGRTMHRPRRWPYWALGLLSLAIILYVTLLSNGRSKQASADPTAYQFSSNKTVLAGVPNSVIFKYDARAAGEDSVFISQSWDVSRKFAVPKDRREYSSIYYLPGYFRAKLIVGKQIVKEHDLMISSNGWLAVIEQDKVPVYFKQKEFLKGHTAEVDKATMEAYNISLQPVIPGLRFYNVQDMGGLRTDNFSFETAVKSNFNQGSAACQRIQILILCKDDVFVIPLCAKGCVGDLSLYAGGKSLQSKDTDLSKFGRDMSQWVQLKIEAKDKHIRILVDGEEATAFAGDYQPSDIVGVQYRFEGPGAVKDTRFAKGDKVITL
ncbi:hypothetical protein [Chitinophaga sp. CF418]|uniref:hypothetical protein n=1 Tax=Chitinophaga sp. CF418 TaxID=1855287 RepID=UPI00091E697E|nr:hypothetical protein [Chitinophaga sp. CF418]SHN28817.1 hypothetical protein SAMN05216311_108135 [Chitinophaga sp. CF418]